VAEGVRDRVELVDADSRDLAFRSVSFDVVVSSLAISDTPEADGRAQALREAVRVGRPGGRLRIVDDGADRYATVLQDAGCTDVAVRQLDWRSWYGIPGHHVPCRSGPATRPQPACHGLPRLPAGGVSWSVRGSRCPQESGFHVVVAQRDGIALHAA
jgi:SAM-dependent methyltransferase